MRFDLHVLSESPVSRDSVRFQVVAQEAVSSFAVEAMAAGHIAIRYYCLSGG